MFTIEAISSSNNQRAATKAAQPQPCVSITLKSGWQFVCGDRARLVLEGQGYCYASESVNRTIQTDRGWDEVCSVTPEPAQDMWTIAGTIPHVTTVEGIYFLID